MPRRVLIAALLPLLVGAGCARAGQEPADPGSDQRMETAAAAAGLPGLTEGAFSRVHELAEGVYVYADRPRGDLFGPWRPHARQCSVSVGLLRQIREYK